MALDGRWRARRVCAVPSVWRAPLRVAWLCAVCCTIQPGPPHTVLCRVRGGPACVLHPCGADLRLGVCAEGRSVPYTLSLSLVRSLSHTLDISLSRPLSLSNSRALALSLALSRSLSPGLSVHAGAGRCRRCGAVRYPGPESPPRSRCPRSAAPAQLAGPAHSRPGAPRIAAAGQARL